MKQNATRAILTRTIFNENSTIGTLEIVRESDGDGIVFKCETLELPYRDNQKRISCIPCGTYPLVDRNHGGYATRYNKKFGHKYIVQIGDVPNRTAILIHRGNYPRNTLGCVLLGKRVGPKQKTILNSTGAYIDWFEAYTAYNPVEIIVKN